MDLKRLRLAVRPKMSVATLAKRLNRSESAVKAWENDTNPPSLPDFLKYCYYCKVTPSTVMRALEMRQHPETPLDLKKDNNGS